MLREFLGNKSKPFFKISHTVDLQAGKLKCRIILNSDALRNMKPNLSGWIVTHIRHGRLGMSRTLDDNMVVDYGEGEKSPRNNVPTW